MLPFSDMGKMFHGKSVPRNQPLPFATVIGMDPLAGIAACAPSPIPEDALCGMLMGEPVELVKCETNDLLVPAHAEIVIEGEILPGIDDVRGALRRVHRLPHLAPRGAHASTGSRPSPTGTSPSWRSRTWACPPTRASCCARSPWGWRWRSCCAARASPSPGCTCCPSRPTTWSSSGVKPAYAGIAQQCAQLVFGSKLGPWFHQVIVVDDKTDIYNINEVIHAFSTRCDPSRDIHIYANSVGTPLNPYASPADRRVGRGSKVCFDCLWPLEWTRGETPDPRLVQLGLPEGRQGQGAGNWRSYGFKD